MLEHFFNDKQTPLLLRAQLLSSPEVIEAVQKSGLDEEFALDLLAQMILYKRTTVPTLVGLLKRHFKHCGNPFQACAQDLEQAVRADLVDWDPVKTQVVLRFDVDAQTHELIRQYQYLPPMIIPPEPVTTNRGSGYLTIRTDSLLLQDNHHEGDLALDSINRFNGIPLAINVDLVKSIRNSWKNIDQPKPDEIFEDFQKRRKAFERYEKDAFHTIALMVEMGNRFHLTHKVDKRGRTYAQGYHINPQGNCWNKAVVELAEPEYVL
jgi:hypothetical protein